MEVSHPAGVEDWLMIRAEELQKKIAEAWQGIGIQESASKDSEWEAMKKVEQHQTFGREWHQCYHLPCPM